MLRLRRTALAKGKRQKALAVEKPLLAQHVPKFPLAAYGSSKGVYNTPNYSRAQQVVSELRFSIWRTRNWLYTDKVLCASPLNPMLSIQPHFVLFDGNGAPRATLRFKRQDGGFVIKSIQMERSQYAPEPGRPDRVMWSSTLEKQKTAELKRSLGAYPTEFLLFNFLKHYAPKIKSEKDVSIFVSPAVPVFQKNYGPLLSRFFKKAPKEAPDDLDGRYILSFQKARVRAALGLH